MSGVVDIVLGWGKLQKTGGGGGGGGPSLLYVLTNQRMQCHCEWPNFVGRLSTNLKPLLLHTPKSADCHCSCSMHIIISMCGVMREEGSYKLPAATRSIFLLVTTNPN